MFGYSPESEAPVLVGMRHGAIREMNDSVIIMDLIIKSTDTKLKLIWGFVNGRRAHGGGGPQRLDSVEIYFFNRAAEAV